MQLSIEQKRALKLSHDNVNLFITGGAGTGKTEILQRIIREHYDITVTASTGIAAIRIGGTTLHNFAGIGLGTESCDELVEKIYRNRHVRNRWTECRMLVIDEISMIGGSLLDKLNHIAKTIRSCDMPFGGIQVIFCGDFLQLPPIKDTVGYAFESEAWKELGLVTVILKETHRQRDPEFIELLNHIRVGKFPEKHRTLVSSRMLPAKEGSISLTVSNDEANYINEERLEELPEDHTVIHKSNDTFLHASYRELLNSSCLAPAILRLKIGARVMLLKNISIENKLANGSLGTVISFNGERPMIKFDDAKEPILIDEHLFEYKQDTHTVLATRMQYPLRLAWAITIHKSQGLTLHNVNISIGNCFEMGQAYVAMSRASSLDALTIQSFDSSKIAVSRRVIQFYKQLEEF